MLKSTTNRQCHRHRIGSSKIVASRANRSDDGRVRGNFNTDERHGDHNLHSLGAHLLFLHEDDATVVLARFSLMELSMAEKSLQERVSAIEAQLAGKTLQEHFREQAELIDQRFVEQDKKWDVRFRGLEGDVKVLKRDVGGLKVDVIALKTDVSTLKTDVSTLKTDVGTLKKDVSTLKEDMVIIRKGMSLLLKKHG